MIATVLLTLERFYLVCGIVLALVAVGVAITPTHPRRWGSTAFWALLATVFAAGKQMPALVNGYLLLAMVALAALKQVAAPQPAEIAKAVRTADALRFGNRLFWPALLVPALTLLGARYLGRIRLGAVALADEKQATVVALALAAVVAVVVGVVLLRTKVKTPVVEGSRLLEAVGWTLILPQLLAALGGLFQKAGVGTVLADLTARFVPTQLPFVAVAAYCLAMALFTMCMGNAFAAFAVITGGIGVPFIVQQHHGNAAIMAAIGMLSGYCGTLMTPMAANFNIVPAVLLELSDKNAVIKAQLPIAVMLLAANIALMYFLVYRF